MKTRCDPGRAVGSWTRRGFLQAAAWCGAMGGTAPTFLARTSVALADEADAKGIAADTGRDRTILVVVQMAGGNDGLNTVIPTEDDHYRRARPRLAIPAREVLSRSDGFGFHPSLTGLRDLDDAGQLAIIQGVGYPNPNRSHFRSMEIWQTASDANRVENRGWLGRYFDHACAGCEPTVGVNLGRQMPQAFAAERPTGISVEAAPRAGLGRGLGAGMASGGEEGLHSDGAATGASGSSIDGLSGASQASLDVLDFLDRTALDARASAGRVRECLARARSTLEYPATRLGQSLKTIRQLIAGGLPTRVYYASQGGYDTHVNQAANHARLLREYGDAMRVFVGDLKAQGHLARVRVMSFSEFGRRVAENGSGGTDHGAGGVMFLCGESFRERRLGRYPSLAPKDLVNGDLRFHVDFRSVYAALLEDWLGASAEKVLGRRFEKIRIG